MKAIRRFLQRRAVAGRRRARKKFLPETKYEKAGSKNRLGSFGTDKFYDPNAKKQGKDILSKIGIGSGAAGVGYGVGSKDDPAIKERNIKATPVSKKTKERAKRLREAQPNTTTRKIEKLANRKTTNKYKPSGPFMKGKKYAGTEWRSNDRAINKLIDRKLSDDKELAKTVKKRDEDYLKIEEARDREVSQKKARKENKKTRKTDINQQKLKQFLEGKGKSDWETKNKGALTGKENRDNKRAAAKYLKRLSDEEIKAINPKVNPESLRKRIENGLMLSPNENSAFKRIQDETLKRRQQGEKNRKSAQKQQKTNADVDAEYKRLKNAKTEGSDMYIKSLAKKNVSAKRQQKIKEEAQKPAKNIKDLDDNQEKIKGINKREGVPEEGKARFKKSGQKPGALPFGPQDPKKNDKKVKDRETGEVKTQKSRVRGTPKEEKNISQTSAAKKAQRKAAGSHKATREKQAEDGVPKSKGGKGDHRSRPRKSKAKKEQEEINKKQGKEIVDDGTEASPEDMKKLRDQMKKWKKNQGDGESPLILESKVRLLEMQEKRKKNAALGVTAGGVIGADLTRRYLRDVKLRHKQMRAGVNEGTLDVDKKTKDWILGKRSEEVARQEANEAKKSKKPRKTLKAGDKVGLYSKSAPKGFRKHIAKRIAGRILTPMAIGGGIGYGISKRKRREERS